MEIRVQNTAKMTLKITDPRQLLNQFMAVILSLYIALFCVLNPPNLPVFSTKYDGVNVNALTDVNLSAKGDLLLQGGEYNLGGNVGLDIGGKVYLQGTVDTQYSFSHVNDNNGFTITDTTKVNQTQVAHMPSMVVGGTNGIALSDKVVLGGGETAAGGLQFVGAGEGAGTLAGLFPKEGGDKGGSGNSKDPYARDTTTNDAMASLSGPGYEYLDVIKNNSHTNLNEAGKVNLTTINYKEQTVQMGVLSQAALMVLTQGMGTWQAFLVNQVAKGVITGEFDPEAFIKEAAMTFITAGVGTGPKGVKIEGFQGVGGEIMKNIGGGLATTGPLGKYFTESWFVTSAVNGVVSSAASSALYGTDFAQGFVNSMTTSAISQAAAFGQNQVGNGIEGMSPAAQSLIGGAGHAMIACASASIQEQNCGAAAMAAFASKVINVGMASSGMSYQDINSNMFYANVLLATVTSGGDVASFDNNAANLASQLENNYLNHDQRVRADELLSIVVSCNSIGGMYDAQCDSLPAINAELQQLQVESAKNTLAMIEACKAGNAAQCASMVYQANEYLDWSKSLIPGFDLKSSWFDVHASNLGGDAVQYGSNLDSVVVGNFSGINLASGDLDPKFDFNGAMTQLNTDIANYDGGWKITVGVAQVAGGIALTLSCPASAGLTCVVLAGGVGAGNTVMGTDKIIGGVSGIAEGSAEYTPLLELLVAKGYSVNQAKSFLNGTDLALGVLELGVGGVILFRNSAGQTINTGVNASDEMVGVINARPSPKSSEAHVVENTGGVPQVTYKDGVEVPYGTAGSVRPDCVAGTCAYEVKNYNLSTTSGQSNLVRNTSQQINQRADNLPAGMTQEVRIDISGQNVSLADQIAIKQQISDRTGGIVAPSDVRFFKQPGY